jgi:hypothetical protein
MNNKEYVYKRRAKERKSTENHKIGTAEKNMVKQKGDSKLRKSLWLQPFLGWE